LSKKPDVEPRVHASGHPLLAAYLILSKHLLPNRASSCLDDLKVIALHHFQDMKALYWSPAVPAAE
jgi:hypothetical protein